MARGQFRRGAARRPAAALLLSAALVALTLVGPPAAGRTGHAGTSTFVTAITQSGTVPPNGTFTVRMQVANASMVHFVYYSFCQLTSGLCYTPPITMTLQNTDWFVGTTQTMSHYHGMNPGIVAGYNISIELTNGTNFTEPSLPNTFSNLKINTSSTGEYMFQMQVAPLVYTLQGVVTNASGSPLPGATVTLTPGGNSTTTSATGAYAFSNLRNGTYGLAVTASGYTGQTSTVVIKGAPAPQNFQLASGNGTMTKNPGGTNSGHSSSSANLEIYAIAGVTGLVVAVLVALLVLRRGRSPGP